ncbi:hypothetical protein KP509_07G020900 [Ceratopteris richardii]|nr:hypothetical protein KP509_07G020900 [Ceratopteris richardii]
MFEASGGSSSWLPKFTEGELHMKSMGNGVLFFQLQDVLDKKILFEHTMRKPDAFITSSQRFFVIRLENDSFKGFGFSDALAACEMKEEVQKSVRPHNILQYDGKFFSNASPIVKKPETSVGNKISEERFSSAPSLQLITNSQKSKLRKWNFSWKRLTSFSYLRNWSTFADYFGEQEQEMEIGYPTDVKHVAHIGWDGPSVCGQNWVDNLEPSPDFATGPLKEFGQPLGPDWIHDALSAAKWVIPGQGEQLGPPPPPAEYLDHDISQAEKKQSMWSIIWLRIKSRGALVDKTHVGQSKIDDKEWRLGTC